MNAQIVMLSTLILKKKNLPESPERYEWLIVDLDRLVVLEVFEGGHLAEAYLATDRYNAEVEASAR